MGEKIRYEKHEVAFLTLQEIEQFLEAVSPEFYAFCATAIFCGARQGELIALRWQNVDLEKGLIRIRESYNEKYGVRKPKTKASNRDIRISPRLVQILDEHRSQTYVSEDRLVFYNKTGGFIDPHNLLNRQFYPAIQRSGIKKKLRFHDLRHSYCGILCSMKDPSLPLKFIQRQMGHASIYTTINLYGHLLPEASEDFGDSFDSFVSSNRQGTPQETSKVRKLRRSRDG